MVEGVKLARSSRTVILGRLALILALVIVFGLWARRPVLALYHLEVGGQAMEQARAFRTARPGEVNEPLDTALRHFRKAVELAPGDGYAHRQLGESWLLAGNNDAAQQALSRAVELRPHDPLSHIALGHAWGGLGQAEKAVAEYELGRYGPAKEEALINYLKLADWHIAAGGGDVALNMLQDKALVLDPNNLPALYRIATIYEGMSEEAAGFAAPIRMHMKDYPPESIVVPSSPLLADYLARTMIALTEDGTWTRQKLLVVVATRVLQGSGIASHASIERITQALVQQWPKDDELRYLTGDKYQ